MTHKVEWVDGNREPQCSPDPSFPQGKDLDIAAGATGCKVALPYPAKRCGYYVVTCEICGLSVGCTTAGRPDDPRSITIPCQMKANLQ